MAFDYLCKFTDLKFYFIFMFSGLR